MLVKIKLALGLFQRIFSLGTAEEWGCSSFVIVVKECGIQVSELLSVGLGVGELDGRWGLVAFLP